MNFAQSSQRERNESSRSERQHKAWGASPRIRSLAFCLEPAIAGDSAKRIGLSPASRARTNFHDPDPGACAPGFMLSPVSRAPTNLGQTNESRNQIFRNHVAASADRWIGLAYQ